jgi:hypothetical protein
MYLHQAIKIHLAADTTVASLVGDRVFYRMIPQKIATGDARMPCVVYSRGGVDRQVTYCETSGLIRTSATLDVYAVKFTESRDVARAVRQALVDYRGTLGGLVFVRAASLENEFDLDDFEPGLYRVNQSWTFWHSEE